MMNLSNREFKANALSLAAAKNNDKPTRNFKQVADTGTL
jgi:hypothetical protein